MKRMKNKTMESRLLYHPPPLIKSVSINVALMTLPNHLALVPGVTTAWRWLAATDFWTHFKSCNSHFVTLFLTGCPSLCLSSFSVHLVSCALSRYTPCVLLSQCLLTILSKRRKVLIHCVLQGLVKKRLFWTWTVPKTNFRKRPALKRKARLNPYSVGWYCTFESSW